METKRGGREREMKRGQGMERGDREGGVFREAHLEKHVPGSSLHARCFVFTTCVRACTRLSAPVFDVCPAACLSTHQKTSLPAVAHELEQEVCVSCLRLFVRPCACARACEHACDCGVIFLSECMRRVCVCAVGCIYTVCAGACLCVVGHVPHALLTHTHNQPHVFWP